MLSAQRDSDHSHSIPIWHQLHNTLSVEHMETMADYITCMHLINSKWYNPAVDRYHALTQYTNTYGLRLVLCYSAYKCN